jgi:hypothetical protein
MTEPPTFDETERREKVANILRECLRAYGLQDEIDETELQVHKLFVAENTGNQRNVSRAILDTMFPRETAPCDLYHYTSLSKLRSIALSGELRLYAVRKRLGQGELDTFAKVHGLKGYLDSSQGTPFLNELSDDLFYASMTRIPPKDPSLMWGVFAEGTGARLQFRIAPKAAELRSLQYEQPSTKTLLNEINEALARQGQPPFLPWTLSRIGAFYLPSTVRTEDEVRLVIKRYRGGPNPVLNDGNFNYWPVPIGVENDVCRVDIAGIHAAPHAVCADIAAAITGTAFACVPVTGP